MRSIAQRDVVSFSFTELLYGIVIGIAIARIESFAVTRESALILVALLLAFEDYLVFHFEVESIPDTGRNFVLLFCLDVLTLACWYSVVIASSYSISIFFTALAAYFFATTMWSTTFLAKGTWRGFLRRGDAPLVAVCSVLALFAAEIAWWAPIIAFLFCFLLWRLPAWKRVWNSPSGRAA